MLMLFLTLHVSAFFLTLHVSAVFYRPMIHLLVSNCHTTLVYRFPSDHRSQATSGVVSTWMGDRLGTPRAVAFFLTLQVNAFFLTLQVNAFFLTLHVSAFF